MRIAVKTAISPFSGYGMDGIELTQALLRAGHDVVLIPQHVSTPLPPEVTDLLRKPQAAPFDMIIDHQDPSLLGLSPGLVKAAPIRVAASMMEYTSMHPFPEASRRTLRRRMATYSHLAAYDEVTAQAFLPATIEDIATCHTKTPPPKVFCLQGGFDASGWEFRERDWSGPIRFLMYGDLANRRKDPWISLQAFQAVRARRPDLADRSRLILKGSSFGLHPMIEKLCPGIKLVNRTFTPEEMKELVYGCHVLLSPSRGEGKARSCLESLASGIPAVATNWGGMSVWMDEQYAYPLRYVLRPESIKRPRCLNARADVEHLTEVMIDILENPEVAAEKGRQGAKLIPGRTSWDTYVERLCAATAS